MKANQRVEILLVVDKTENLFALEAILDNQNYSLIKANCGNEALKILMQEHDFAIIIMDANMPQMDGFETAKLIRHKDNLKNTPIIFLGANSNQIKAGFKKFPIDNVDYITEPLSSINLKPKVSVFVELYKKNQELIAQAEKIKLLNSKLTEQSHYVRSLIESALDPMITVNPEGKITDVNKALITIIGMDREKIKGTDFFNYFNKPKIARKVYDEILKKGSIVDYLLTIKNKYGKPVDVLVNGSIYKDDQGDTLGVILVAREKLFSKYSRGLIEASPDPLITINSDGKITDMNKALENIIGLPSEEITGTNFFDHFTEPEKAVIVYQEVFAKGFVIDFPLTIRHKDGTPKDVLLNGSVYKDDKGNVLGVVITARDITSQKKFESKLIRAKRNAERAKQIAEDAVKAKQQFLSNMSHEIRTPMNAIVGFTKVVLKTDLNEKQREYLNAIKISGDALIVLVNDILDLAKVDAGKMTFEQIPFKLSESIYSILPLFETKIQEKGLKLIKKYDASIPETLIGDPVRLNQIILNLVGNAIKFTPKGKITVSVNLVKEDEKRVTIEFKVSDTGVGIAKNKLESIFDYFQQATTDTSRVYGGTGLGLAIVKQLVVSQGGAVNVKSKLEEGSTFCVTLNFIKEKANQKVREKAEDRREEYLGLSGENGVNKIKVLVAEDVVFNQLLMKTLLSEEFGFETDIAENGKITIEKLGNKNYDIILMDLQMPEMNGSEATKYIRNTLKSNIPIIALTADVTTVNLEKCKAIGMNDYISKPVDDKLLYIKIQHLLKNNTYHETIINKNKTDLLPQKQKYINLNFLRELTRNNSGMILEMIKVYLEETPQLINIMKHSINNNDWDCIRATAHSILPSFATMGMNEEFTTITETIREFAEKKENPDRIKELVSQIELGCDNAYKELHFEMASLKNL